MIRLISAFTLFILSLIEVTSASTIYNYKTTISGSYKYDWFSIKMGISNGLILDSSNNNIVSVIVLSDTTINLVMSSWWPFPSDDYYTNLLNLTFDSSNYLFQTWCYNPSNSITNSGEFQSTIVENLNSGDCLDGQLVFDIEEQQNLVESNRSFSIIWPYNYQLFVNEGFVLGNNFSLSSSNRLSLIMVSTCDNGKTNCNDWIRYIEIGGIGTLTLTTWNNNNAICGKIGANRWSCSFLQYNYVIKIE